MNSPRSFAFSCTVLLFAAVLYAPGAGALADIYPGPSQAKADLAAGLRAAAANHRRVILDFGGNWCPDCHVLEGYFHNAANEPLLAAGFVLVHVNIGRMDENIAIAQRYQIPLKQGVPALAVLDSDGRLLYSQQSGEFQAMRHMQADAVTAFLTQWTPPQ